MRTFFTTTTLTNGTTTVAVPTPTIVLAEDEAPLVVADPVEDAAVVNERFDAVLCVEGVRTTDLREIAPGSLTWRELPLPLTDAENTGDDHMGTIVGMIESIEKVGDEYHASGFFDMATEAGREAARLVSEQIKRWVSIDLEVITADFVQVDPDCNDMEEWCDYVMVVTEGRIMGAAMVGFPAFPQAVIVPEGATIPASSDDGRPAVTASIPVRPPAEWFENPGLTAPTPMTVDAETGRVFGHVAGWNTCHTGYKDVCMTAPSSPSGYAYYLLGEIDCDCEPSQAPVIGQITLSGGHADESLSWQAAKAHYDDTRSAVADVAVGEDAHGIWFAGALRPGVTAEQIRVLRASPVSGDWRRIGGALEMIAVLSCNAPGFPIVRAHVASGKQSSLVAAGVVREKVDTEGALAAIMKRIGKLTREDVGSLLTQIRASRQV